MTNLNHFGMSEVRLIYALTQMNLFVEASPIKCIASLTECTPGLFFFAHIMTVMVKSWKR